MVSMGGLSGAKGAKDYYMGEGGGSNPGHTTRACQLLAVSRGPGGPEFSKKTVTYTPPKTLFAFEALSGCLVLDWGHRCASGHRGPEPREGLRSYMCILLS